MRRTLIPALLPIALSTGLLGCAGLIGEPPAGPAGADGAGPRGDEVPATRPELPEGVDPVALPPSRLWRLTPVQYVNSFEAAFGAGSSALGAEDLPADPFEDGYDNSAAQIFVGGELARLYHDNAVAMAEAKAANPAAVDACLSAASPSDDCVSSLLDRFGAAAYRRPLAAEEKAAYLAVFRAVEDETDAKDAVAAMFELLAQSPYFLYRAEIGEATDAEETRLTHYEIASELSYMLTDAPPDAALLAAAANEELHDRAAVRAHALRLLDSAGARAKLGEFFAQYLKITGLRDGSVTKDADAFPGYSAALQGDMLKETMEFARSVVFDGEGTLTELFTAPYSFVTKGLADVYGLDGVDGAGLTRADLPAERAGLMTQASVLAVRAKPSDTDPLHRGLFVYQDLLCNAIAPPADVDVNMVATELINPAPNSTKREDFEYFKENSPSCAGCHGLFVPLGLAFETFDAMGAFRETQYDKPIVTAGDVAVAGVDGAFETAPEMIAKIMGSDAGQACFVERYASFALGRTTKVTPATLLAADFEEKGLSVRELLVAVTEDDVFYYRTKVPADGTEGEAP